MDIITVRKIIACMTAGVTEMHLSPEALQRLLMEATRRWLKDKDDCFTKVEPDGINVILSNGHKLTGTALISDFPGLSKPVFIVVDDSYELAGDMLVTILLPNEIGRDG